MNLSIQEGDTKMNIENIENKKKEKIKKNNIINLSKHHILTQPEITLLNKGLTFIPTWRTNNEIKENLRYDLQKYHRKLKLAAYFEKHNHKKKDKNTHKDGNISKKYVDCLPFTPRSDWAPAAGQIPTIIETIIQKDVTDLNKKVKRDRIQSNLTKSEILSLKRLRDNKHIVIKPADKGSSVVILDRFQYLWEGNRQLADRKHYIPLKQPIYPQTIPMIVKILDQLHLKKYLNLKQKKYLIGQHNPRPRRFYWLPKIHKSPEKWSKPWEIPPGRPIVSDCGSETYYTAEYIDYFLYPLSIKHKSYIKDTYDFVNKIRQTQIPLNSFLFTMDVNSLYTNIDTTEGMKAVQKTFLQYPDTQRPEAEILKLLFINLTRNDFEFNGKFYLQINGTAMGKKFAPSYANIFMAHWEIEALQTVEKKPMYYYRYLDDIWGIWTHTTTEFWSFIDKLNKFNKSIQITAEINSDQVNFLDTTTYKGPDFGQTQVLDTKVFFKPTDTHALLYKTSYHPNHTFRGLVKSQLIRFNRICSRKEDLGAAVATLYRELTSRGYSRSLLRKTLNNFTENSQLKEQSLLPIVVKYSTTVKKFMRKVKQNFNKGISQSKILTNYNTIIAFKRNRNLQDYLVTAQIKPLFKPQPKTSMDLIEHNRWLSNPETKEIFKINAQNKTDIHNCVYLIRCTVCNIKYIGETKNNILTRFHQHKYNIIRRKNLHLPINSHFILHGWKAVRVTILESNPHWSQIQRRQVERKWILRLGTFLPQGLNVKSIQRRE